jgi:hypothetical protein
LRADRSALDGLLLLFYEGAVYQQRSGIVIRATLKAALGIAALLAMPTAGQAARYIKVQFETNPVNYYALHDDAVATYYTRSWSGEVLIDTQQILADGNSYSIADSTVSGGTMVRYSASTLLVEQDPTPDGHSIFANFGAVSLADPTFESSLVSGEFNDTYITHSRYELTDKTKANLRSLTVTGFDSDEELASYVRWTSAALPGAVPEPASWALMIVGFGGVGAALRRRRSMHSSGALLAA